MNLPSQMIEAEGVTKRFGAVVAVRAMSFSLGRGQIVGVVGPNGAGKSTLLRLLATYLFPSSGRLRVEGLDVVERPLDVRRRIGYLPGDTPLYHGMRTDQFLAFLGRAHALRGAALRDRVAWAVDACALEDAVSKRIRVCSTGYRKRIGLAAALIHDPRVILLDEPTHGLDPLQVLAFRDLLERLRPGRTILVSSHVISEIAQVADRLLLIHDGALLADGTLTELYRRAAVADGDLQALFVRTVRDCEQRRVEEARDA